MGIRIVGSGVWLHSPLFEVKGGMKFYDYY